MPSFSKRQMNRQMLQIIRKTGRLIACYQENSGQIDPERIPANPYLTEEALDTTDFTIYYIFGSFVQNELELTIAEGQIPAVTGMITVPRIYTAKLMLTTYFDPYCNGSKFQKVGAVIDDEDIVVYQKVKSISLPGGAT